MTGYGSQSLADFLDAVATPQPAPGGGAVAAMTTALSAGLVAMAARYSRSQLPDADQIADQADVLRREALELGDADSVAYAAVLDAYKLPRRPDPDGRKDAIRDALRRACDVPMTIAGTAAEVAQLAVMVRENGNPGLQGDAATAAHLATAAASSAAELVRINARLGDLGEEPARAAGRHVQRAETADARLVPRSDTSGSY
ncbi:MAG: cyclodeaminase/cyclohydrolase family protein [Micromonosporaceae bacterium]